MLRMLLLVKVLELLTEKMKRAKLNADLVNHQ
jgi:hypothetical protein